MKGKPILRIAETSYRLTHKEKAFVLMLPVHSGRSLCPSIWRWIWHVFLSSFYPVCCEWSNYTTMSLSCCWFAFDLKDGDLRRVVERRGIGDGASHARFSVAGKILWNRDQCLDLQISIFA